MSMTNKQLKELLNQYPDESIILIWETNNYGGGALNITSVSVDYVDEDEYAVPQITLK